MVLTLPLSVIARDASEAANPEGRDAVVGLGKPRSFVQDSDQDPTAPYLSFALKAPPNLSLSGKYRVEITIHHHFNEKANPGNKPITFTQTYLSQFLLGRYILLRQRPQGPEWSREECACTLINVPDEIFVGQNSRFISLALGECHTTTSRIWPDTEFVENLELGADYSYQYIGNEIAWWNWGRKENHGSTRIWISETSHNSRPRIVLPASNPVNFTIIEWWNRVAATIPRN
ncbi:hypothetical protein DM02DRAFT_625714 [Periconia macrospinosa]|uniref:Uncharacterized protein n=1 Tax=Periconia macrospinosa TaxID=97972 RepID=A0A2V1E2L0_9PLEO|nr:hypothetical protein DM02DRAFT_625714 [Periconia macrospinosa]